MSCRPTRPCYEFSGIFLPVVDSFKEMKNASSRPGVEPAGMAVVIQLAAGVTVVLVPATTYCSCRERHLSDCCWEPHLCSHTHTHPSSPLYSAQLFRSAEVR